MAYGYANVGVTELADMALDKPLLGANTIPKAPTSEFWNQVGNIATGDLTTATGFPIARLHDADPGLVTKPDAAQTAWYVVYDFGASNLAEVDFCAIGPGHNLGTSALAGLALEFDQNQNGAFTAVDTCDLVASFPTSSDDRIMQLTLRHYKVITAYADGGGGQVTVTSNAHGLSNGDEVTITGSTNYNDTFTVANVAANTFEITHSWDGDDAAGTWKISVAQRYSDVQYCRLKTTKGAGFTPQITELVVGARYQMPRWPNRPFNKDNIGDLAETSEPTKSGSVDKTIFAEHQFRMDDVEWTLKNSETTALRTWWKKTRGSFLWVWEPTTAPASYNLMVRDTDRLDMPYLGWKKHSFSLSGIEQGPESEYLENE